MKFDDLHSVLMAAKADGLVNEQAKDSLRLYCYSRSCVYDRAWNDAALISRGLILDVERREIAATPFPKFFNVGERDQTIPALSFETFEKVDGSLIIIFWHDGKWKTATKGSLQSSQAQWAAKEIERIDQSKLMPGTTYLAEAVYPENRIVIHYAERGLVLLAAYDSDGGELTYDDLSALGVAIGCRTAKRYAFDSVAGLLAKSASLPVSEEGFVIRFENGLRLKVKGDEYRRIHALISRCTPLAMWEAMLAGDDLGLVRRDLPEEFWTDFDTITAALNSQLAALVERVEAEACATTELTDKEVGLSLDKFPADVRPFIFPWRKNRGDILHGRSRLPLFKAIRPTANQLAGYVPSYAMNRVLDETL